MRLRALQTWVSENISFSETPLFVGLVLLIVIVLLNEGYVDSKDEKDSDGYIRLLIFLHTALFLCTFLYIFLNHSDIVT